MGDLWGEIQETMRLMDLALKEARDRGAEAVGAEAEYYTAKAEECFRLRDEEGLAVSMVNSVVKGQPAVAPKMTAYHAAQVSYDNAREAINVYKKRLDTLREEYEREWSRAGSG